MKNCFAIFGLLSLPLMTVLGANPTVNTVVGRTIYHADNSRTESVRDPNIRELTEITYNPNNVVTVKKVFLLNEKGEPTQGNIYDGRGALVARCQSLYDDFGRRKEDRLMNLNGEVFQQVIHEYTADGKAKTPKVVNLNVAAPSIKPASIDFTKSAAAPQPTMPSTDRFAPVQLPAGATAGGLPPIYAPGTGPAGATPPTPEKPKASFFKRLFSKEKK
ncbi:MAG: hypothetical protein U0984_08025 [Prosthecobacter sp.]|nr:hypothetical protein [Prosthecobacter sp.]